MISPLPRIPPHSSLAPMPASRILVIDDQPINVQLLKRKLEREGLQVARLNHVKQGCFGFIQHREASALLLWRA